MMKRAIAAALLVVLTAMSASATDYTFVGKVFNAAWDNVDNWSPTLTLPGTTGDSYSVSKDGNGNWLAATQNVLFANPGGAANTRYFGSVTVDNGNFYVPTSATGTYRFMADNGQSGSLVLTGINARMNRGYSGSKVNFVMDGDFIVDPNGSAASGGWWGETASKSTVTMKGVGATYRMDSAVSRDHTMYYVTVDNDASVDFAAVNGGVSNAMKFLELRGGSTASGTVLLLWDGKEDLKVTGSGVDHTNLDVRLLPFGAYFTKPNPANNYYVGQGQFIKGTFRDVEFGPGAGGATYDNAQYTGHLIGALHVRNLAAGNQGTAGAGSGQGAMYIIDTDNLNVGSSNLTIDQNLTLGSSTPSSWAAHKNGALKANNSQVKVGGNVTLKYGTDGAAYAAGAYILGGTSTWNVGGNWTVDCGTLSAVNWDMGTSLVTFDGNSLSNAQAIASKGLPFFSVDVNNPGGTVTLVDNLALEGNFDLTAGTLVAGSNYIIFHGGIDCETLAQQINIGTGASLSMVHIASGSDTWVKLMSDLTVTDNLDIDAGCKLFLNGFNLYAASSDVGQDFVNYDGVFVTREGGEIVGSAAIPEPATLLLLGTGALGVLGVIRRRRMP